MGHPKTRLLGGVLCLVFLFGATGWAQRTTGSLGGFVQDSSGAVIPGAEVTVTNEATGVVWNAVSEEQGAFVVLNLPPGTYTLAIRLVGFKSFQEKGIGVESARDLRGKYVLEVGQVVETVTVQGATSLVNTIGAEQRVGVERLQISELPNPNRNITNLLILNPAVVAFGGSGDHRGLRLNGMGGQSASYTMDGVDASGGTEQNQISQYSGRNRVDLISIDGVQEVQIIKGVVPAEYGDTVSGQVNVISRSGTSQIHGSLFHLYQGARFNAKDPFLGTAPKPNVVYNQYGGSVGFPIFQARKLGIFEQAFGFFAYEGYEERRAGRRQDTFPTQKARDEIMASTRFDSREKSLWKLTLDPLPLPNVPTSIDSRGLGGLYVTARGDRAEDDTMLLKGDVHLADKSQLSVTWNRLEPSFVLAQTIALADRNWLDSNNRIAGSWFKATRHWNFESRMGWTRVTQERVENIWNELRDPANSKETVFGERRVPSIDTAEYGTIAGEIWTSDSTSWKVDQKIGYIKGNHNVKFGGSLRHWSGQRINPEMPAMDFRNHDDVLANKISFVDYTFGEPAHLAKIYNFGLFAQDDWKVRPNFTLNLGVRYDYFSNMTAEPTDLTGSIFMTYLNLEPPTNWPSFNFGKPLIATAAIQPDRFNFGPRFGFNWDVGGNRKMIVRGGFGVMFAPITPSNWKDPIQDLFVPRRFNPSTQEIADLGVRFGTLNGDMRPKVVEITSGKGFNPVPFTLINPYLQEPYSMTYTLGIQRELMQDMVLEVDYVGQRGVKFPLFRAVNPPDRVTGQRPNPKLVGTSLYMDESNQSLYSALQMGLKKRFTKNLSYGFTYAWGRALAIGGADLGNRFASDTPENWVQEFFDPKLGRGRTLADIEHNFTANWYYRLPGPVSGFMRNIAGGWNFSGIVRAQTGPPIGAFQATHGGRRVQTADILVSDFDQTWFPDYRQTLQFWNPAAFARVPLSNGIPVHAGNSSNSLVSRSGFQTVDLSLGKDFSVTEGMRVRLRWDWFNSFNHVRLGGPQGNVDRARFGEIRGLGGGMRTAQLNLRFEF
jgi:outer membrane receptor protein involved in Fe transport